MTSHLTQSGRTQACAAKNKLNTPASLLATAIFCASAGVSINASANDDILALEEIVVTAQKREQNLQDVPIAVSAFSGAQLQEAVIKDIFDLKNSAPGLQSTQENSNSSSSFRLRGIGTSALNFGLESAVGMYVDGVYRARQSSMVSEMIDIEAVEILRGPQGTLFGKNTPAGAILFRTAAPSHEEDGYVSVTAGNYGQLNASAAGSVSVIDDVLALRGTVFSSHRDGTIDAEGFGSNEVNDKNREGLRLQALYTPTDELTVRVIGDYSKIDETCCGVLVATDNLNVTDPATGLPTAGSDAIIAALGGTVYSGDNTDEFETALNQLPESNSRDRGLSFNISWDGDDYSLHSISAYRKFNSFSSSDVDFTDVDLLSRVEDAQSTTFSQEFRIDYSGDDLNVVAGLYYFTQDLDLDYALRGGDFLNTLTTLGGLNDFINGTAAAAAAFPPGLVSAADANPFIPGMTASHSAEQEHESWAVFGQFDYILTDTLTLTAGLRYTKEEKEMTTRFSESWATTTPYSAADFVAASTALGALGAGDPSLILANPSQFDVYANPGWGGYLFDGFTPRSNIDADLNDEQITGTVKLSWAMNDETLSYVSYGTGYKSGGTNTDRIAAGFSPVFDAETSESFELGIKTEFPDQALRLNAALHFTTVDDFQSNTFTGTGFVLQNAGELESYGAELELLWLPAQNTEVTLAYAYTKAEFKEFKGAGCQVATPTQTGTTDPSLEANGISCDRSGGELPFSPDHTANLGIKQNFELSNDISAYIYGEYSYLSDHVLGNDNDPLKHQDAYGLLNLRAGLSIESSDIQITLWGRNVLDEDYKGSTFDAPLQDGKLYSSPGEPRTYGLTVVKNF